jgi:hypothetical protein
MLPQPLTGRMDGVGEVFRTNLRCQAPPAPQIFTHGDFFENKTRWKQKFMARPPKPPAYLDEFAAQQWKAKAKQLAERGI